VILKWRTTTEAQIAGFNVYRKMKNGQWTMENGQLIQAKQAGNVSGAGYRFRDLKVKQGASYQYRLQVVYLDGRTEWAGLVKVKTR